MAAIIIAIVSAVISAGALYFQFFHKIDRVICTLVGYSVDDDQIAVQLAISNAGSRSILLRDARLRMELKCKDGSRTFWDDHRQHNIAGPILIPRDAITSIALRLKKDHDQMLALAELFDDKRLIDTSGKWPFSARLIFVTVSGKIITSEEVVLSVLLRKDGHSLYPREKATWTVGPVFELEDFTIV